MDKPADRRNVLGEGIFTYRVTKDRKAFISWRGRQVSVLSGRQADSFIAAIAGADGKAAQLIMAKATGNFKRGNENPPQRRAPV